MQFNYDEEQKLRKVLEHFLSLHEADEIYDAVFDEDISDDAILYMLRRYEAPVEETNPSFWDCNCSEKYIHPKVQASCPRCNAKRDSIDQPDSHVIEVKQMFSSQENFEKYWGGA